MTTSTRTGPSVANARVPGSQIVGVFDADADEPEQSRDRREVRVVQCGSELRQSCLFHLEFDHAEPVIVEHDELHRKAIRHEREQIAEQHREATVGHRTEIEGTEEALTFSEVDEACQPHG